MPLNTPYLIHPPRSTTHLFGNWLTDIESRDLKEIFVGVAAMLCMVNLVAEVRTFFVFLKKMLLYHSQEKNTLLASFVDLTLSSFISSIIVICNICTVLAIILDDQRRWCV
jgi:Na+-transporting NADH:ubiquinone oxidoreductase subunit NqrE